MHLITACLLLCTVGLQFSNVDGAGAAKAAAEAAAKTPSTADVLGSVASSINKASAAADATAAEHMKSVSNDPGNLITKNAMTKILQGSSFLPQKSGTRSISLQASQGFNGITNYQPSGWKITESMSGPSEKKSDSDSEKEPTYTYPMGLGPVLLNQCTERNYSKTSPCYNSKLFDLQNSMCMKLMDAAAYVGVGFDGRGFYKSESRKASLVQRVCANKASFMDQDVPDTMNVFGIFDTTAETKSFQSVDEYMRYIRHKAGQSNQKNLFKSEASKYSSASGWGLNLGGVGAAIGAGIGALAGGPVGAAAGASIGGAVGSSIGGGSGSGSGNSKNSEKRQQQTNTQASNQQAQSQGSTQSFFAIMYVNVILYEITLDEVKPTDLSLSVLKDYMSLPSSYYSVGADVKYQNFLLRYGTHFIRAGKFGGQLKVTKTLKTSKSMTSQEFARISQSEFQSMFATLQSSQRQKSSGFSFLGLSNKKKKTKQSAEVTGQYQTQAKSSEDAQSSQSAKQSEFTQTTVEAQGGTSEIAEALMDFYTPAFKQLFHDWLVSIKDYAKPFEFQLKALHDLFYMSMKDLFPAGNMDFGCVGDGKGDVKVQVEAKTGKRFYIDTRVAVNGTKTVEQKVRVDCKFSSIDEFEKSMDRRRMSLEKAISVYMVEGPFPTSSFDLAAGETGCEEKTIGSLKSFKSSNASIKFSELMSAPFILALDMPQGIPNIASPESKFKMALRDQIWYAIDPKDEIIHLYDGCKVAESKDKKICFRNILLTYDEASGFFHVDPKDFLASKQRIPSLPNWLSGSTIARPKRLKAAGDVRRSVQTGEASIPCNVKWLNSHRLDPKREENCIHFTAATEGDIFVVFASIPKNHHTWYYLQISPDGAAFYQGMDMQKRDVQEGMGVLGNENLYQSFFVCVSQKNSSVIMQYGKADPDSEVGTVYSGYEFPARSRFSRLSFYSFGSGEKPVSLMDIRLTKQMPKVTCLNSDYIKKDGHCVLNCHSECQGCKRAKDSKSCHQCKHMRVEDGSGDNKVTECLAQCPAGKHPSDTKTGLCVPCPAGEFKDAAGNRKCSACAEGTFSSGGASKCSPCSAGTFNNKKGQSSCKKCSAGTFTSENGAKSCSECPAGKFSDAGQSSCSPCPFGHFGDKKGLSKCTECPEGFNAAERGLTSCTKCPTGTSSSRGSRSCDNSCRKGQFSPDKGVACKPCPAGSFAESAGSSSCSRCRAGSYQDESGQSSCKKAPKGAFVSEEGATKFVKCRAGTFNDKEGQASSSSCQACPAGSFSTSDGAVSCSLCDLGHYQSSSGQTNCQKTSPGNYADVKGLKGQKNCRPGFFSSAAGASSCSKCPKGSYAKDSGTSTCTKCPAGQYAASEGLLGCNPCSKGYEAPSVGSSSCSKCKAGYYAQSTGTARCDACKAGSFAKSKASTSCLKCAAGSSSSSGASSCTKCSKGKYSGSTGQSTCKPCAKGTYASGTGSTKCQKCQTHYYASTTGRSSCEKCKAGTYTASTGSSSCQKCKDSTRNTMCNAHSLSSKHVGCYKTGQLSVRRKLGDSSPYKCFEECRTRGATYFGMKSGNQCYCGDSVKSKQSHSNCNSKCKGNNEIKCGSGSYMAVYKTDFLSYLSTKHLGCYKDKKSRALDKHSEKNKRMTLTRCYKFCLDHGEKYMGVESADQCYCGSNHYDKHGKTSGCNDKCKGDSKQKCGGHWKQNVYRIR